MVTVVVLPLSSVAVQAAERPVVLVFVWAPAVEDLQVPHKLRPAQVVLMVVVTVAAAFLAGVVAADSVGT